MPSLRNLDDDFCPEGFTASQYARVLAELKAEWIREQLDHKVEVTCAILDGKEARG